MPLSLVLLQSTEHKRTSSMSFSCHCHQWILVLSAAKALVMLGDGGFCADWKGPQCKQLEDSSFHCDLAVTFTMKYNFFARSKTQIPSCLSRTDGLRHDNKFSVPKSILQPTCTKAAQILSSKLCYHPQQGNQIQTYNLRTGPCLPQQMVWAKTGRKKPWHCVSMDG